MLEATLPVNLCWSFMRGFCVYGASCRSDHVAGNQLSAHFSQVKNTVAIAMIVHSGIREISSQPYSMNQELYYLSWSKPHLYLNRRQEPTGAICG